MTAAARPSRRKVSGELRANRPDPRALLAWYDRHRRILPWRAKKGEASDPYRVWLSEIMLQQTTVKAVAPYYARFLKQWRTVEALAEAELEDVLRVWAGLGYYARARNLHACAKLVAERGGHFPNRADELTKLPGIGRYTAAAIASIAFDRPVVAVDGNVERVVSRLFAIEDELPRVKARLHELADSLLPNGRFGDFTQALMDLGATICTPKNPACSLCPWSGACAARKRGDQKTFPRKAPKRQGALRRGAAFVVLREDGCLLLRRRPGKGLLGGMSEVPGSDWSADFDIAKSRGEAPKLGKVVWRRRPGVVTHVFTHFPLELTVFLGQVPPGTPAPSGARWVKLADVAGEALPNVMRKVVAHALEAGDGTRRTEGKRLDAEHALP
jgi:A/G-specific adenine glycosylase